MSLWTYVIPLTMVPAKRTCHSFGGYMLYPSATVGGYYFFHRSIKRGGDCGRGGISSPICSRSFPSALMQAQPPLMKR